MVIQPCVCIAASHVGLAGLPVLAVYSSATFCISATLFCFSFTDILSKISCLNFCGAKVQLFFDIRKHLEKNLLISLLFTVNPLCQRSFCNFFKCLTVALYFHIILYLYYSLFIQHAYMYAAIFCFVSIGQIIVPMWLRTQCPMTNMLFLLTLNSHIFIQNIDYTIILLNLVYFTCVNRINMRTYLFCAIN